MKEKTFNIECLKHFRTEDLMNEVFKRNDIIFIGNYFFKNHIKEEMERLGILASEKNLKKFFDRFSGDMSLGVDFARDDLEEFLNDMFDK